MAYIECENDSLTFPSFSLRNKQKDVVKLFINKKNESKSEKSFCAIQVIFRPNFPNDSSCLCHFIALNFSQTLKLNGWNEALQHQEKSRLKQINIRCRTGDCNIFPDPTLFFIKRYQWISGRRLLSSLLSLIISPAKTRKTRFFRLSFWGIDKRYQNGVWVTIVIAEDSSVKKKHPSVHHCLFFGGKVVSFWPPLPYPYSFNDTYRTSSIQT